MDIQEIIVYAVVAAAAFFALRTFLRQFTRGEAASPKCADCALNQTAEKNAATQASRQPAQTSGDATASQGRPQAH